MTLTPEDVDAFFRDGYLVQRQVFGPEELAPLRRCFARIQAEGATLGAETGMHLGARFVFEGQALHRVVWAGALEEELLAIGQDPRLLGPVGQLLGSDEVVQLLNQCHFKLPGDEVAFAWHQDSQNRHFGTPDWTDVNGRGSFVQTILAVDDAPADSGPLEVFPGSCALGHLGLTWDNVLPDGLGEPVALTATAGDVLFFGPYTIHGSGPNRSPYPRRVLINGYACPGANRFVYPGAGTGRPLRVPPA
ncbi:MAG: phytanoyl-CoA dioxygenase family protein [Planctomycetota bacterium]